MPKVRPCEKPLMALTVMVRVRGGVSSSTVAVASTRNRRLASSLSGVTRVVKGQRNSLPSIAFS